MAGMVYVAIWLYAMGVVAACNEYLPLERKNYAPGWLKFLLIIGWPIAVPTFILLGIIIAAFSLDAFQLWLEGIFETPPENQLINGFKRSEYKLASEKLEQDGFIPLREGVFYDPSKRKRFYLFKTSSGPTFYSAENDFEIMPAGSLENKKVPAAGPEGGTRDGAD